MSTRDDAVEAMRESLHYRADVPDWMFGHLLDAIGFDGLLTRAVTAETDLASACSEIARWGKRATTAETALAAAKGHVNRHRLFVVTHDLKGAARELGQLFDLVDRLGPSLLDVPDQLNPTEPCPECGGSGQSVSTASSLGGSLPGVGSCTRGCDSRLEGDR